MALVAGSVQEKFRRLRCVKNCAGSKGAKKGGPTFAEQLKTMKMKKLFLAAALGLGMLFAVEAGAQTPATQAPGKVQKTEAKTAKPAADRPRDAHGRFVKEEQAKPATERQRDEKGRFVKSDAKKQDAATSPKEQPRDEKGRFVKKTPAAK